MIWTMNPPARKAVRASTVVIIALWIFFLAQGILGGLAFLSFGFGEFPFPSNNWEATAMLLLPALAVLLGLAYCRLYPPARASGPSAPFWLRLRPGVLLGIFALLYGGIGFVRCLQFGASRAAFAHSLFFFEGGIAFLVTSSLPRYRGRLKNAPPAAR